MKKFIQIEGEVIDIDVYLDWNRYFKPHVQPCTQAEIFRLERKFDVARGVLDAINIAKNAPLLRVVE